MIRYAITEDELNAEIDAIAPTWRDRAKDRTETFRTAQKYDEASSMWGEIKSVYMDLQHDKCGYCERILEDKRDMDVEHFRPKKSVKSFTPTNQPPYPYSTGGAWDEGYYLLAYHPQNYLIACKMCNETLKKSYFPIAGTRQQSDDPKQMVSENPFLIYPIGDLDDDPEMLLEFVGIHPKPRYPSGHEYRRVEVMIDLFELDVRETLLIGRAKIIYALWLALTKFPQDQRSQEYVGLLTHPASEHCNCARSFHRLFQKNPVWAEQLADYAHEYLKENHFK